MNGRAFMEKLIADRLGAGPGRPEAGRRMSFDLAEIRGVAAGLVAAGALDQEEMRRILADLERTLEQAGWLTQVRFSATGSGEFDPTAYLARTPTGAEHPPWRAAITDPPVPVLRDVIPLTGRVLTVGTATASLISLDVWSTMLTLRMAYPCPDRDLLLDHLRSPVRWRGWDDLGTQYRGGGGSGMASSGLYIESVSFEPGPAGEARTLTLHVEDEGGSERLTIALSPSPPPA